MDVPRYFNFPLKGDEVESDDVVGFRNVFTDFNQIVRSDERSDKELFEKFTYRIITSPTFKFVIYLAIIINVVIMLVEILVFTDQKKLGSLRVHLQLINNIILGVFLTEIMLKYHAIAETFWYDVWNIFDLALIGLHWFDTNTEIFRGSGANSNIFSVLRTLRVIRSKYTGLYLVFKPRLGYLETHRIYLFAP